MKHFAAVLAIVAVAWIMPAHADDIDLSTWTCKRFLDANSADVNVILAWLDGYYQHNNVFGGPKGFGSEPCAYDRASMLRGSPNAKQICFLAPTIFDDGLLPADIDSPGTLPPAGQPDMYLGSIDNTPPTPTLPGSKFIRKNPSGSTRA